jgi:peptidoglycan-N-acetylglucosamine deacetylase
MLRPALSRHHLVMLVAALLGAYALAVGNLFMFGCVTAGFLILIGLGVVVPGLRMFGPFVCRGSRARPCVALTFDDGPDPRSTPQLLELLHHRRVEAAFFCVGRRVAENPALAGQMFREGHLLENHSYSHSNTTNFFSVDRLRGELEQTQSVIRQATGAAPRYFRPPMGLSNPRVFRAANAVGLIVTGWTARGLDTITANPNRIVRRIKRRLRPGAIILLHDGNIPADRLLATVKTLLDTLHSLGYEVVRLDRLLK